MRLVLTGSLGALVLVAMGCNKSTGGRQMGTEGGQCLEDKACDPGLRCIEDICVRLGEPDRGPRPDGAEDDAGLPDGPAGEAAPPKECAPACTTGSCCDGECVDLSADTKNCGECGNACSGTDKCVAGACKACTPRCAATNPCGVDGCGGSCGTCSTDQSCDTATGECTQCAAMPICGARVCGDDGCGHSCGTCGSTERCIDGQCGAQPPPDCSGKLCGDPDGAGGFCQTGSCPGGGECSDGKCSATCQPDCVGKSCGNDGCGGSCGECSELFSCSSSGTCTCTPWCTAESRECGPDGCGGLCGTCSTAPKTHCNKLAICTADPATVGCSDGTAEGFEDKAIYPQISSCQGQFPQQSMRATRTGTPCGNSLGACQVPEDLCASGWHLCMRNGWPADLSSRVSGDDCSSPVAGPARFMGGSSQATGVNDCTAPLPCNINYVICCGTGCTFAATDWNDCVWPDQTPSFNYGSCNSRSSVNDGVICCKDPAVVGP